MASDPVPVDINRKGSNFVVDHLEIVKAGLRHRETRGLGSFPKSSLAIKSYGKGARDNLVGGDKEISSREDGEDTSKFTSSSI